MTREEILDYLEEAVPGESNLIYLCEDVDASFVGVDSNKMRAVYSIDLACHQLCKQKSIKQKRAEDLVYDIEQAAYTNAVYQEITPPLFINTMT